ncbi:hypothetical protein [Aquimarina agarivorans]|uniref:hypothetical protein n=1 Tax=Aquimarina agarivorans TaxID=980584 RepID=UPI000248E778|nr:hypothetical protein [Aquimarina agarivorans]
MLIYLKKLFFFALFIIGFNSFGQNNKLTNGRFEVKLTKDSFLDVQKTNKVDEKGRCIDCMSIKGTIKSIAKDSLTLNLDSYCTYKKINGKKINTNYQSENERETYTIGLNDINFVTSYRNKKAKKRTDVTDKISGILTITGVTALIGSLFISNSKTRSTIRGAGYYQSVIALGLTFGSGARYHNFKKKKRPWAFENN